MKHKATCEAITASNPSPRETVGSDPHQWMLALDTARARTIGFIVECSSPVPTTFSIAAAPTYCDIHLLCSNTHRHDPYN
jgi:hypothetical protein